MKSILRVTQLDDKSRGWKVGGGSKNYLQTPATHQSFYEDIVMKSYYLAIVKPQL